MKTSTQKGIRWGVLCGLALCFTSCYSPYFTSAKDVNPSAWDDPAMITIHNTDTTTLRDIGLFLRSNDRFAEDTLTVQILITTPTALRYHEYFRIAIPHTESPTAIMRETDIDYRRKVHFAQKGDYRITITPTRSVEGVEAVGIHIIKSE